MATTVTLHTSQVTTAGVSDAGDHASPLVLALPSKIITLLAQNFLNEYQKLLMNKGRSVAEIKIRHFEHAIRQKAVIKF